MLGRRVLDVGNPLFYVCQNLSIILCVVGLVDSTIFLWVVLIGVIFGRGVDSKNIYMNCPLSNPLYIYRVTMEE